MIRSPDLAALLSRPIAHRGLHACGKIGPVENSVEAARAAIDRGFGIECDVQLSRDGDAVVFHDTSLDRLTASRGHLIELEAATLSKIPLRGGGMIPTLERFLAAIDGRTPLVIEIKADGGDVLRLTDRVLASIASYAGAVAIESFDPSVVLHARRAGTKRPVGLVGPGDEPDDRQADALAAADFLSWSIDHLPGPVDLPLSSWTVRSAAQRASAARHHAQIVFEGFDPDR